MTGALPYLKPEASSSTETSRIRPPPSPEEPSSAYADTVSIGSAVNAASAAVSSFDIIDFFDIS